MKVKFIILLAVLVVLSSFAYSDIPPPPPVPSFGGSSGGVQDIPPSGQPKSNVSGNASSQVVGDLPPSPPPPSALRNEAVPSGQRQVVESPPRQEAAPAAVAEEQVSGVKALGSRVSRLELLLFASLFLNVVAVALFVVVLFAVKSRKEGSGLKDGADYVRVSAIRNYVRHYTGQGYSLDSIKRYLLSKGYDEQLVERALQDGV